VESQLFLLHLQALAVCDTGYFWLLNPVRGFVRRTILIAVDNSAFSEGQFKTLLTCSIRLTGAQLGRLIVTYLGPSSGARPGRILIAAMGGPL